MSKSLSSSLVSPRLALRVAARALSAGTEALAERRESRRPYNADKCLNVGRTILDHLTTDKPMKLQQLIAPSLPLRGGYGRTLNEASSCPVLQAKHGMTGIFVITEMLERESDGLPFGRLTRFVDSTEGNDDVLSSQSITLLPDNPPYCTETLYKQRRQQGKYVQLPSRLLQLPELIELQGLVLNGFTTTATNRIEAAHEKFESRVRMYVPDGFENNMALANLIPQQNRQGDGVNVVAVAKLSLVRSASVQ